MTTSTDAPRPHQEIDTHDDIPFNFATEEVDPCQRLGRQVDVPKMREVGLEVGFFIVGVGRTERTPENYAQAEAERVAVELQGQVAVR